MTQAKAGTAASLLGDSLEGHVNEARARIHQKDLYRQQYRFELESIEGDLDNFRRSLGEHGLTETARDLHFNIEAVLEAMRHLLELGRTKQWSRMRAWFSQLEGAVDGLIIPIFPQFR